MDVCRGVHPDCQTGHNSDRKSCTGEKVLIQLGEYDDSILPFINNSPCTLTSRHVHNIVFDDARPVINALHTLENVTSLNCFLQISNSVEEFAKIVTILKEKYSMLNEISVMDFIAHENPNMEFSIPAFMCRRIRLTASRFTSLFKCACHPSGNLQSLHIKGLGSSNKLKFDSGISKIIEHNRESLLDLRMEDVLVAKNSTLLQETLQKCHTLVVLSIGHANNGSLTSVRLHEIFCSIQGLLTLEYLHVYDEVNVFGEDLCALHKALYHGLPKLKDCQLSFQRLVVYFTLLGNPNFEPIQELVGALLSGKKPSPHCHTVAFRWRSNPTIDAWLASLRCNVNFHLLPIQYA